MATISTSIPQSPPLGPPPLQQGDRLTRQQFEERFDATPGLKKAELIEGVVHMAPPVSETFHGAPHAQVLGWLVFYQAMTPGVIAGDNSSLRLGIRNMPQPDGYLRLQHGGTTIVDAEGYVVGAPELILEVSASTASYDLHSKLNVYRRHRVQEYVVWRVYDGAVDWFVAKARKFQRLDAVDGVFKSEIFPGLWLDAAALVRGDMAGVLATLQRGISLPEHAEFVTRLRKSVE